MTREKVIYWSCLTISALALMASGYQYLFGTYFTESKIIIDRQKNTFTVVGVGNTGGVANFVKAGKPTDCARAIETQYPDDLVPAGVLGARPIFRPGVTRKLPVQCISWSPVTERQAVDTKALVPIDWNDLSQKALPVTVFILLAAAITAGLKKLKDHEDRTLSSSEPVSPTTSTTAEPAPTRSLRSSPTLLISIMGGRKMTNTDMIAQLESETTEALVEEMAPSTKIVEPEIKPGMSPTEINLKRVLAWANSHMRADEREAKIVALNKEDLKRTRNYT